MTSIPNLETVGRDVRYAWRVLRRAPAFTVAATLTLAMAVAVNTAVFSVVDAVLIRPLPYPEPQALAVVSRTVASGGTRSSSPSVDGRTWEAVRDVVPSARSAVLSTWTTGVNLISGWGTAGAAARYVQQQRVGAGFFATLGVAPALGREFSTDDDRPGGPPVAILGDGLWRRAFGADAGVVGRTVMLRGAPHVVVGVMPAGFESGERADLWTPLRPSTTGEGGGENYRIVMRLRPGASWAAVDGELARVAAHLRESTPSTAEPVEVTFNVLALQEAMTQDLRQPLLILWAAVAIVLVIACVNLAGLLLARGSGRRREIATRMALGSGRSAVVRQLLVESAVLAAIGGAIGIALASLLLDGMTWLARDSFELWQPVAVDARSIAAGLALCGAATLVFGLVPAVQTTRLDVQSGLKLGSTRGVTAGAGMLRRAIVVAQVALGVVLLVSAGLLVRTFSHLRGLEPGFDAANVLTASISLEDDRYRAKASVERLFDGTLRELTGTAGVEGAAVALEMPYRRLLNLGFRHADGPEAARPGATTSAAYVSSGFFEALRIPVRRGRTFTPADRDGAPPVVIVSDAFVRTHFEDGDPVGRRIRFAGAVREIVGQVGDVQVRPGWGSFGPLAAMPTAYVPYAQVPENTLTLVHGWFSPTFIVRAGPAVDAEAATRRAVDAMDPLLPLAAVRPVDRVRDASIAPQRLMMSLLSGLAVVAVLLAGGGLHGLITTAVTERTREIGVHLALGATRGRAIRTLVTPGLALAGIGVAAGLAGAAAVARTMRAFVWGVSVLDPITFTAVGLGLIAVAVIASILPALRVLKLDPAATLRTE